MLCFCCDLRRAVCCVVAACRATTNPHTPPKKVRVGIEHDGVGNFEFDDAWEVEQMPASRCVGSVVVLPNGKVLLVNGVQQGFGGLDYTVNEPHAHACELCVSARLCASVC